jgi:hypothetical protein
MKIKGFDADDFDPKDFLVDLQTDYVTHFPTDLGLSIGFLPRDFSSDRIYDWRDWQAEVMHWSNYLPPPDDATLARICERACQLYVEALKARDLRRALRDRLPCSSLSQAHCRAARAEVLHVANNRVLQIHQTGWRNHPDDRPAG